MPHSTSKDYNSNRPTWGEPIFKTYTSGPWKWVVPILLIALIWHYCFNQGKDREFLVCQSGEVKIPYCLQCSGYCIMECGGDVKIPNCQPSEAVDPPSDVGNIGPRLLGKDGKPFIVEMTGLAAEAKDGRTMSWAGTSTVNWIQPPKISNADEKLGLCWGRVIGDNMTYECVEIKK
ncbi:hypothetical protein RU639_013214 [Aspergillus parasiticus]